LKKKPKKKGPDFLFGAIPEVLSRALQQLARPPHPRSERVESRGALVARFVLRLDHCRAPSNRMQVKQPWQYAQHKEAVWKWMRAQYEQRDTPLPGRPLVRCIRFSVVAPDRLTQWSKVPVDKLCAPRKRADRTITGLNFLTDDRPECADVVQWWEPAKRGEGCVLLEVWTG